MIHAFAIFLTVSFYIANLATVFITAPAPDQPIQGIKSFTQLGTPACLGNKTAFTDYMRQSHPDVNLALVSPGVTGVLDAMLQDNAPCLGGVMTDVLFQYETGPVADPGGKYCNALMIGPQMGTNYYAIPFAIDTNSSDIIAINILVSNLIVNGEYGTEAAQNFFVDRPQCQTGGDNANTGGLSIALEDFSGVFLVQAIGIVAGLVVWFFARTFGFATVQVKRHRGSKLTPKEDVGCLRYFFRAEPTIEEQDLPDELKAFREMRALLDKLEQKAERAAMEADENGVGTNSGRAMTLPAAARAMEKKDHAPKGAEQQHPGKIVLELSSGSVGLD